MLPSDSPVRISQRDARRLADGVGDWFKKNARPLPWRSDVTPYRVWLSEVMAQQTRVDTASGYFLRFVDAFPTVKDLAEADLDDVMALWSGLGYYSRCRNLHKTAQQVHAAGGAFPREKRDLLKLPGVGPYTASAIAVFAFGQREGVLDGNVWRVLSRVFQDGRQQHAPDAKRDMQARAQRLIDEATDPKATAEGLMELGATLCQSKRATCAPCPLRTQCAASSNDPLQYPPKKVRAAVQSQWVSAIVVHRPGGVWLEKAAMGGLFAGLVNPPMVKTGSRKDCAAAAREMLQARGITAPKKLGRPRVVERTLTHRRLSIVTYSVPTKKRAGPFVAADELIATGLSSAAVAVLAAGWPDAAHVIAALGRGRNASTAG